jgi:predicted transposase YdaD
MRSHLEAELALETEARSRLEAEQALAQEKQTIALSLLKQGIEMETIAQATGLSIEQLGKLREGD